MEEGRLFSFCIFPYDIIKLIFLQCDAKTRYNMLTTCKRLFSEFYPYAYQRRWLMIGFEPPPVDLLRNDFGKCEKCNAVMLQITLESHVCKFAVTPNNYCHWCMGAYAKGTQHDEFVCIRRRHKFHRCMVCGTWHHHREAQFSCPLEMCKCKCILKDGEIERIGSHARVFFQQCEVCTEKNELMKAFSGTICPKALPRCTQHAVYECFGCKELIDPAVLLGKRHVCLLIEHRLQMQMGRALIKLNDNAFVTNDNIISSDGFLHSMFVRSPFDIPSLLPWESIHVFLLENQRTLVKFTREGATCQMAPEFPEKYCATCITTACKTLKWCQCKRVMYCCVECQTISWPLHKIYCRKNARGFK